MQQPESATALVYELIVDFFLLGDMHFSAY